MCTSVKIKFLKLLDKKLKTMGEGHRELEGQVEEMDLLLTLYLHMKKSEKA